MTPDGCPYPVVLWWGEQPPPEVTDAISKGATFVAHNAEGFDAIAWRRFVPGPQPSWYDTAPCCRSGGLPPGLDKAAKSLGGPGKDDAGKKMMKLLTVATVSGGEVVYRPCTPQAWIPFLRYNIVDVLELERVYNGTRSYGEPDVMTANARVNERGAPVDIAFARALQLLWKEHQAEAVAAVKAKTDGAISDKDLHSPAKVKKWLASQGVNVPSLERKQVEYMIADPEGFFGNADDPAVARCIEVLRHRESAVRAVVGKVDRVFTAADPDARVRNMFVYYGAEASGRFSGRELQPHNMPRGDSKLDVEGLCTGELTLARVKQAAERAGCSVGDALGTLMRPIICPGPGRSLVIADYGQVEARFVNWLARQEDMLAVFADPSRDVYREFGAKLFHCEVAAVSKDQRQVSKVAVLGCGYGMGVDRFRALCDYSTPRVDLAAAGTTAEEVVKAYRSAHPNIVAAWKGLEQAAKDAVNHGGYRISHRVGFEKIGNDLHMILPSGRHQVYHNIHFWDRPAPWNPALMIAGLEYETPHGYFKSLYGGLLVGCATQGSCRDLMANAMVKLDAPCWETVLHVHDELVLECEDRDARELLHHVCETMSTVPDWAAGMPLRVEGFTAPRYVKAAWKCSVKADYMLGKEVVK